MRLVALVCFTVDCYRSCCWRCGAVRYQSGWRLEAGWRVGERMVGAGGWERGWRAAGLEGWRGEGWRVRGLEHWRCGIAMRCHTLCRFLRMLFSAVGIRFGEDTDSMSIYVLLQRPGSKTTTENCKLTIGFERSPS